MIDVTNASSNTTFDIQIAQKAVLATLDAHNIEDYEVSILLTDDLHMTELNLEYRGIDAPTDVLAFAMREGEDSEMMLSTILGDVVISLETAERHATTEKHSLEEEVAFLTVHGMLHLLGYDHQTQEEAAAMFNKQETILKHLKVVGTLRVP
ncbi:MAG: rRNA maturation RNase YbeY [Candidatus Poribacteria bacterium]|nr:rRNA maturation RNase YbeY [Candidatus Poribacteria bacterium]